MKRSLILNAIDPRIGGVLIRGERGTAKSTAARGLAAILPEEEVIAECRFGCDPHDETNWCTECKARKANHVPMTVVKRRTPFINLPVSATEDRVVGTLDIEEALKTGQKRFEPGVLAAANRGVLYIDEVNLLEDHVVDILLDAAAMGVNRIEREGISFSHPARFILVGTMNPEEGDLRPQLLDRFAHSVDIQGIAEARDRVEIMVRHFAFENSPEEFAARWYEDEKELTEQIRAARKIIGNVTYTTRDLLTIASLSASMKVEGHRADLIILKTARAQAAFEGRTKISDLDIASAAELALPHRLQKGPFSERDFTTEELKIKIDELRGQAVESISREGATELPEAEKKNLIDPVYATVSAPSVTMYSHGGDTIFNNASTQWWEPPEIDFITNTDLFQDHNLGQSQKKGSGKRSRILSKDKHGSYFRAQAADGELHDLALDATLRKAALAQKNRQKKEGASRRIILKKHDLMKKVRSKRSSNLLLFLLDLSWSMAVQRRMDVTRSTILSLLTDAYQHRDKVGLVTFQKDRADIVVPPTFSVALAERSMKRVTVGGKTPLSAGLLKAYEVLDREKKLHPDMNSLLIVLTDGAGNVSLGDGDPMQESKAIAERIAEAGFRSIVIDLDHNTFAQGLAHELAKQLNAPCYLIAGLKAKQLTGIIRKEL